MSSDVAQLLALLQFGLQREQPKTGARARRSFDTLRIVDARPEHLHAAANPDHPSAIAYVPQDGLAPALRLEEVEVGAHVLAPRQDDEVARWQRIARSYENQFYAGVQPQRIEVGVVADAGIDRHGNAEKGARTLFCRKGS